MRKQRSWLLLHCTRAVVMAGWICGIPADLLASGSAENTALVVNADSWASRAVANEYIRLRRIPDAHVVRLEGLPSFERLSVEEFRQRVLLPVLTTLDQRQLSSQIDLVVYSSDIPTSISLQGDLGDRKVPKIFTPVGSVNGLTFLYRFVLAKDIRYLDLNANFYAQRTSVAFSEQPWPSDALQKYAAARSQIQEYAAKKRGRKPDQPPAEGEDAELDTLLAKAFAVFHELKAEQPTSIELLYNMACAAALLGRPDDAVAALREAVQAGWRDHQHTARDEDLSSLRDRPDFKALLSAMQSAKPDVPATLGFRSAVGWLPSGAAVAPEHGPRYLLSTVLAVTSGRGTSVSEAIQQLRRSAAADGTRPAGTIYFLRNGNVRSTTREWAFAAAADKLQELGVRAVIEQGILPKRKPDVAGAMIGSASFSWPSSGSTILPGAIVEHFTSFGGMMTAGAGQTPLSELLRHGAGGASGTVAEPYSLQAKFPTPFLHVHYAQGCSLAEAFYQSVTGPYQLLIVGDGLCQPWARRLDVAVEGWQDNDMRRGDVVLRPTAQSPDGIEVAVFELYVNGRRLAACPPQGSLAWNTRDHADGPHDLVVLARGKDPALTTGRWSRTAVIGNGNRSLTIEPDRPHADHPWDRPLTFRASSADAKEIVLEQHDRTVSSVEGAEGSMSVDPRTIGPGPVRLVPIARFEDGASLRGRPIEVNVVPPAPLPAQRLPGGKPPSEGWMLRVNGRPPVVVTKADRDWLSTAGVDSESTAVLEAWVEAQADDLHQLQLHGNVTITALKIDDQVQSWPRSGAWWFVPVPLAKGWHRLTVEFTGARKPTLDLRFGLQGTQTLDPAHFRNVGP